MKFWKSLLVVLIILANLVLAQPSFADRPKYLKNPEYIEVTKSLDNLVKAKEAQAQAENYNPEEIQRKIDELEFQKYAIETGINWGQCRNETGKTLAVYGPTPKFEDDDYEYPYDNALYFLADGQTTKNKWDCDGVYLPGDATLTGITDEQGQAVSGPVAVKIGNGTQLVVKTNSTTGAVEFNIAPTKVFKTGEVNWFIPNVTQALIDARVPNAPAAKIKENQLVARTNSDKNTVESNNTAKAQPQTQAQPQPQTQAQPQPQTQAQPQSQPQLPLRNLPKEGYYSKP